MKLSKILILIFVILLFSFPIFAEKNNFSISYFGELGCSHCDIFAEKTIPKLENFYNIAISVQVYDILNAEIYEKCRTLLEQRGYKFVYFPVVITENNIYQGETEIQKFLESEIKYFTQNSSFLPERTDSIHQIKNINKEKNSKSAFTAQPTLIAVLTAGLIDGINPCAFTVLLFFFSYLSLRQKSFKRFLGAGISFISAVFITYIFIGLGFYSILSAAFNFSLIRIVIKIIITIVTSVFAVLSISDLYNIKAGNTEKAVLKLPSHIDEKIRKSIRSGVKNYTLFFSVFVTGVVVSFMELACTGQIYLPTIIYILKSEDSFQGMRLLLFYNLGFIIPLAAVFIMLISGVKNRKISDIFRKHMYMTKILITLLFVFLTISIWII